MIRLWVYHDYPMIYTLNHEPTRPATSVAKLELLHCLRNTDWMQVTKRCRAHNGQNHFPFSEHTAAHIADWLTWALAFALASLCRVGKTAYSIFQSVQATHLPVWTSKQSQVVWRAAEDIISLCSLRAESLLLYSKIFSVFKKSELSKLALIHVEKCSA